MSFNEINILWTKMSFHASKYFGNMDILAIWSNFGRKTVAHIFGTGCTIGQEPEEKLPIDLQHAIKKC